MGMETFTALSLWSALNIVRACEPVYCVSVHQMRWCCFAWRHSGYTYNTSQTRARLLRDKFSVWWVCFCVRVWIMVDVCWVCQSVWLASLAVIYSRVQTVCYMIVTWFCEQRVWLFAVNIVFTFSGTRQNARKPRKRKNNSQNKLCAAFYISIRRIYICGYLHKRTMYILYV